MSSLDHRVQPLADRQLAAIKGSRRGNLPKILEQRRFFDLLLALLEKLVVDAIIHSRPVLQEQVAENLVDGENAGDRRETRKG